MRTLAYTRTHSHTHSPLGCRETFVGCDAWGTMGPHQGHDSLLRLYPFLQSWFRSASSGEPSLIFLLYLLLLAFR